MIRCTYFIHSMSFHCSNQEKCYLQKTRKINNITLVFKMFKFVEKVIKCVLEELLALIDSCQ